MSKKKLVSDAVAARIRQDHIEYRRSRYAAGRSVALSLIERQIISGKQVYSLGAMFEYHGIHLDEVNRNTLWIWITEQHEDHETDYSHLYIQEAYNWWWKVASVADFHENFLYGFCSAIRDVFLQVLEEGDLP